MPCLTPDSRTSTILPLDFSAAGQPALVVRALRKVTFMVEAVTVDEALGHLNVYGVDGAVVICKRGPKGGFLRPVFMDATTYNGGRLQRLERAGFELHLGRMHAMEPPARSPNWPVGGTNAPT